MPKHSLKLSLPSTEIGNSDVIVDVSEDGNKLGTIRISKGRIDWIPKYAHIPYSLSWSRFDKMMKDNS